MKRAIAAAVIFVAAIVAAPAEAANGGAPAWSIVTMPYPTHFVAGAEAASNTSGPAYQVQVTNVGGGETSGPFTITDVLPGALKVSKKMPVEGIYGHEEQVNFKKLSCKVSGRTVTCTGSDPVDPGEMLSVNLPVGVEPDAPPLVVNKATVEGGGAAPVSTATQTTVSPDLPAFGLLPGAVGLSGLMTNNDGSVATQAGSHPYQATVAAMGFPTRESDLGFTELVAIEGGVRTVVAELPRGMVVDPQATPVQCTEAQLEGSVAGCPLASQIGTLGLSLSLDRLGSAPGRIPLYNMVPLPGHPAVLGAEILEGTYAHLLGSVSADGTFTLSAQGNEIPAKVAVAGIRPTLWGVPSDESHDFLRGACSGAFPLAEGCAVERTGLPFVSLPSSCGGPLTTTVHVASWAKPDVVLDGSYESADSAGNPVGIDGCNQLEFEPTITSAPTTNLADSPSGLDFNLHVPQAPPPGEGEEPPLATANLRDAKVVLPKGLVVNPSAASGLGACASNQIGLATQVGETPIRFDENSPSCPSDAKVGSVEVTTPLLGESLPGAVYLAKPFDNPFGSLLALYLVIDDAKTGIVAKLPGRVEADPVTGQLTARFAENPELPVEDVAIHFFNGARATLTTPQTCGSYTTAAVLTPWSTPEGADATPSASFKITAAPGGGSCPSSEAAAPNSPAFSAGTVSPQAGSYSPFVLKLSRPDGSQRITAIEAILPKGLTGKLAGIPYCSEAQIAQAMARSHPNEGALEITSPSCPLSTEVGTVDVGAGSGSTPLHVTGHAYWAGPSKGAPLSLVIITPAVAGPFDLGVVVVRSAIRVDPETAQIKAVSDPLPTILHGIPLDVRSIEVDMSRPSFILNPTSCDPTSVMGSAIAASGQAAGLSSPFQVGGCAALPFKPRLSLKLKGGTRRGSHPVLTAVATAKPGEANLSTVSVALPHSAFLDQGHIKTICTRVQFFATSVPGEGCPRASIYGKATATTPLLSDPLSGPVFLRSSSHPLPDLVVALHGQVDVVAHGRIDSVHGGIRNTFEAVPDAPLTKFTLQMQGGKKGLIVNSRNICKSVQRATVRMEGQNGKTHDFRPVIGNSCKKKASKARGRSADGGR